MQYHYCPVKREGEPLKATKDAVFQATKGGVDLNGARRFWQSSGFSPGGCHEYRQDAVRPTDGFSALDHIYPNRRATWWQPLREIAGMYRSISRDGLRATSATSHWTAAKSKPTHRSTAP